MSEIVNIDHETGDLSQYSFSLTDGGDLSVITGAALIGIYGLSVLVDGTGAIYGQKTFTQIVSNVYRGRFYYDPNGQGATGQTIIFEIFDISSTRVKVWNRINSGNQQVKLEVKHDGGSQSSSYQTITDESHYIEFRVKYATSAVANDGEMELFIDGSSVYSNIGLDLWTTSKPDKFRAGMMFATSGTPTRTYYLDDIILRNDDTPIGAVAALLERSYPRGINRGIKRGIM